MKIPPKSSWTLSSTTPNAALAADADMVSGWQGAESPHELRIDLGEPGEVGGVALHWGRNFGFRYTVSTSLDGENWAPAYTTEVGEGKFDLLSFTSRPARHVRLQIRETAGHAGFQLVEIEVLGPDEAPRVVDDSRGAALDGTWTTTAEISSPGDLVVDLAELRQVQGLRVDWGETWPTRYTVQVSEDGQRWTEVGRIVAGVGEFDSFYHPTQTARYLKLAIEESSGTVAQVRHLKFRLSDKGLRPLGKLEAAAKGASRGVYPAALLQEQVYWTLVGTAAMREESLLDEYGMLEIRAGKPSVLPLVRLPSGQILGAAGVQTVEHELAEGALPVPSVRWEADQFGFLVEALATDDVAWPIAYRFAVQNRAEETREVAVLLTIRPVQVNPEWQHGGASLIHDLAVSETGRVLLDGVPFFTTLQSPARYGVAEFGEGDIGHLLEAGGFPDAASRTSGSGLLSGVLEFPFTLGPGESARVEFRAPLREDDNELPDPSSFEERKHRALANWEAKLGPQRLLLNDPVLNATLRSQIGYTLVNQNGPALQPGSRNYDRTWIRDGSAHAVALMQAGLTDDAKAYLRWYSQSILPNGLVPPILNPDGSINTGHGSNLEFDAQGQFIWAVAEAYRLTRDQGFIEELFPKVRLAMEFLVELRNRTMEAHPEGSRFHGILAPSISHEGYGKPTHSYWDDFFGLKGWSDGADLARLVGDEETARWAAEQREQLEASLRHAIRQTIADFGIGYIPSSSDLGDFDPTSTSISYLPCDCADVLPDELLEPTYARYLADVRERYVPGWRGRFTPYDLRNINAFVGRGLPHIAHELLDYLMTCRRPSGWNHWAEVIIGDARMADYIGDMPHTWIGAELCAAVRRMVVHEQGDVLHLLPAVKPEWLQGAGIRLHGLPTHFGALTLHARDGGSAIELEWSLAGEGFPAPRRVTVQGKSG